MIKWVLILLLVLLIFLIYPMIRVRFFSSVKVKEPAIGSNPEVKNLHQHIHYLSERIGSRSAFEYEKINAAKDYIERVLKDLRLEYTLQSYQYRGKTYSNIIVTRQGQGKSGEVFIIGAHYDTVMGTPGADDNASAVAVLLELCRLLTDYQPSKTLKLIFFVLEEPPTFNTRHMGSYVYAKAAKDNKEKITGMISLEMVGYYNDKKGSQLYPLPLMSLFYPKTANFIGVVGDIKSRRLVKKVAHSIKKGSAIPVESLSTVKILPGVDFSDHGSFWKMGYPAVMITDTAFYRNPNYHSISDTIATLDFDKMVELLPGLRQVVLDLT
ncbi:MAG: M28 family peptidase [Candidatus Aminicenantes bacterium]|nr:MAG: M28 family peptidase [Candidatus Aminicenantes bacterium]